MFNVIDYIFLSIGILLLIFGYLINNCEGYLPRIVLNLWGGSISYRDTGFEQKIGIPKSFQRHIYLFASFLSCTVLIYMLCVYLCDVKVDNAVCFYLDLLFGDVKPVSVTTCLLTTFLFTCHVSRRLYETLYLQIFSKTSKMNLIHYLLGIVHYTAYVLTLVGYAPLFTGHKTKYPLEWTDCKYRVALTLPCVAIFVIATFEQHRSNIIVANLRTNSKGRIVTYDYRIPEGGWFHYVSSPHRLCEVVIYATLFGMQLTMTSFLAFLSVFIYQTQISIKVHKWYLNEFKNYPMDRNSIIPFFI